MRPKTERQGRLDDTAAPAPVSYTHLDVYKRQMLRRDEIENLTGIYDLERLMTRIAYGTANARELRSLSADVYKRQGQRRMSSPWAASSKRRRGLWPSPALRRVFSRSNANANG